MVQRPVLSVQLPLDGAERLNHDVLPNLSAISHFLAIIASWRNHLAFRHIRLRVADDDDREHVHILRVELGQRHRLHLLFLAPSLSDIAHRRFC